MQQRMQPWNEEKQEHPTRQNNTFSLSLFQICGCEAFFTEHVRLSSLRLYSDILAIWLSCQVYEIEPDPLSRSFV
jgi:hypothetical protein